jgi:arabinogalactan oligomer / maltooligosaccharide transport system permease protein
METYFIQQRIKHTSLWIFNHLVLLFNLFIVLTPLLWMIVASFSPGRLLTGVKLPFDMFRALFRFDMAGVAAGFQAFTANLTLEQYEYLFTYRGTTDQVLPDYWEAFSVSLYVAILNTILVVILSSLVGFAFSRYKFIGKKRVLLTFMGLQMFPAFMGMIALFMLFRQFGFLNNPTALTLIYVTGAIPYNTFIIRGFMRNIPKSLDEAAAIDGANNLQIMTKIIIPLAVPIMGFVAVNAFMAPWMDYILPSVIMPQVNTLAVWLFKLSDPLGSVYSPLAFMAGALFIAVPIMVVQVYMQRFVVYGLTAGADKG